MQKTINKEFRKFLMSLPFEKRKAIKNEILTLILPESSRSIFYNWLVGRTKISVVQAKAIVPIIQKFEKVEFYTLFPHYHELN